MIRSRRPSTRVFHFWSPLVYDDTMLSGSLKKESGVVRELSLVDIEAVGKMGAVVDVKVLADVAESFEQVVRLLGILHVRIILGVTGQSCADVEITTVGNSYIMLVWMPGASARCIGKGDVLLM
jgi:hypothetical protein